eukprot:CAMPEP_0197720070 /NCGR_PEP_ID=MMETSP1434-20131217/3548_1 /TAXON_ID=265543 /ORGANISM="Minutocellus polymorphus, Strain CCMP3303" /LENGTH=505 /DNA_ID=CAMNT_0043304869 /DNA_START=60 /DNA_END=1577 /DNA_ORIENTATION=-
MTIRSNSLRPADMAVYVLLIAATTTCCDAEQLCASGSRSFASAFLPKVFMNDGTSGSFSPTSLRQAFSMIGQGAGAVDAAEIQDAMARCPLNDNSAFTDLGEAANALQVTSPDLNVSIANGVFVDESFPLNQGYADALEHSFGAIATEVSYQTDAGAARDLINSFVSNNTNGIIPKILTSDPDPDTVLFLVNALYFGAKWVKPFEDAYPQQFSDPARGQYAYAQMMTEAISAPLVQDGGIYSAISLPYRPSGSGYEMLIIKPGGCKVTDDGNPIQLNELINGESGGCLDSVLADAIARTGDEALTRTSVTIPRFQIKWRAEETLKTALKSLGLNKVFSPTEADLSGIPADSSAQLFVSQVVHQVDVRVNEQGTEAAAATGLGISVTSLPVAPPAEFRADEPFIYAILHRPSNTILFSGWVNMDALEIDSPIMPIEEGSGSVPTCSSTVPACPEQPAAAEDDDEDNESAKNVGDSLTSGASGLLSSSSIVASSFLLLMVAVVFPLA